MKKYIILISIISIIGTMFSCNSKKGQEETKQQERVRIVKTTLIEEEVLDREIDYPANLLPNEEIYLAPSMPGRILKVNAEVGDRVPSGKVLVEMDPTQLNTTKMQLMNLEKEMQRLDTLIKFGGVSQQQYDQMKTQITVAKENYELLKSNVNLKSPFSGIITGKYFENGELYSGAPNTAVGKAAVVTIQQTNPIKAVISVQEKYYPKIKKGMKVNLLSQIFSDDTFEGTVSLVYPTVNAQTKTFNVEILIPNGNEMLKPGMYSKVNIKLGEEKAMVVPAVAVLQQLGTNKRYVMVYDNGVAHKVYVEDGKRFDDKIEIFSEKIKIGDKIIIAGQSSLEDGFIVKEQ